MDLALHRQNVPRQMQATKSFYQPLEPGSLQIRILCLQPGVGGEDTLKCNLIMADLSDRPEYEALSYVWGDRYICASLIVDNHNIEVTVNLEAALRRLRQASSVRRLWVDAICINQDDIQEKSHQVSIMSQIYVNTANAVLWLGEFAIQTGVFGEARQSNPNTAISAKEISAAGDLITTMAQDVHFCPVSRQPTPTECEAAVAIVKLSRLPWWTRAWTVQEMILPLHATVVYGSWSIDILEFLDAKKHAFQHIFRRCCHALSLDSFVAGYNQLTQLRTAPRTTHSFVHTLSIFRDRKATDPRDKLYSLMGLGKPGVLFVDYNLSTEAVYIDSLRRLLRDRLDLCPLLRLEAAQGRLAGLPSWVPDFGGHRQSDSEEAWLAIYYKFRASDARKMSPRTPIYASSDPKALILQLAGYRVDRIKETGPAMPAQHLETPPVVSQWQNMYTAAEAERQKPQPLTLWYRKKKKSEEYPWGGGSYWNAFWRSMIADLAVDSATGAHSRRATAADEEESCRWWQNGGEDRNRYLGLLIAKKRFFVTEDGGVGIGDESVGVGDEVFVLLGGRMPFTLRPLPDKGKPFYGYVGQAYVHGVMDGQVLGWGRDLESVYLV